MNSLERLIYMANQIARNFAAQGETEAIAATADHIAHFWDPRMRAMILAYAGDELNALAKAAVRQLRAAA